MPLASSILRYSNRGGQYSKWRYRRKSVSPFALGRFIPMMPRFRVEKNSTFSITCHARMAPRKYSNYYPLN